MNTILSLQIPVELMIKIQQYANQQGKTQSGVVREILCKSFGADIPQGSKKERLHKEQILKALNVSPMTLETLFTRLNCSSEQLRRALAQLQAEGDIAQVRGIWSKNTA